MTHTLPLPRAFYDRPTLEVARDLLGARLIHEVGPGDIRVGQIVETEAYIGPDDLACHASRGRTVRTEVMFGPSGHAYVYLIYGMYNCLNVVTEAPDFPAAVLVRAVEPIDGLLGRSDGPGRLCRALGIGRRLNGTDLTRPPLYLEPGQPIDDARVAQGPRVGVDYAGEWASRPWRFWIAGNPHVSRAAAR